MSAARDEEADHRRAELFLPTWLNLLDALSERPETFTLMKDLLSAYPHYILELRLERERREKAEAALNRIKYACKENDEESCAAGLFGEASAWRRVGLLAANALSPSLADGTGGGK
jgi:hypothetical protein